jgi:hypothetical protein
MSDSDTALLEAFSRVETRLNELVRVAVECPHILTTEEAVRYAKLGSDSAFYRWAEKWHVAPCAYGRWSRAALDMALNREAGLSRTPATLRRRPKSLSGNSAVKKPLHAA